MKKMTTFIASTIFATAAAFATNSHAGLISASDINASTNLSTYSRFSIDQIVDGITSDDAPFNGFAANGSTGVISLDFVDGPWDLTGFNLWNDINIQEQGVMDFRLDFLDDTDSLLGSTSTFTALTNSLLGGELFEFDTIGGVSSVDFVVLSSKPDSRFGINRIEIREVAFEGTRSQTPVPVPSTLALFALALSFIATRSRRKVSS